MPDFSSYLESVHHHYEQWWSLYTLTDAEGRSKAKAVVFDFGLMVQTIAPKSERMEGDQLNREEPIERFTVLDGLRKYAEEHVLLVGRLGSGKSTALARLLLEEAGKAVGKASPLVNRIPVLVELRYWNETGVLGLIQSFLRSLPTQVGLMPVEVDRTTLEELLRSNRFLLLIDGLNELPSEVARQDVLRFRREFAKVAIVFTTRDLSLGGDFGIEKKLEMQPLTEAQMKAFVMAYVPEQSEVMLRQLGGRLREFGSTPLLLWMLCEVFKQSPNSQLPSNLAGIFQIFTGMYESSSIRKHEVAVLKGDVSPLSDRRLWKPALKHLAAVMMQGEKSTDFRVVLNRTEAEEVLSKAFPLEKFPVRDILDDLLKYHLLQNKTPEQVEFRHQLIQEYYAAEWLLGRVGGLDDATLQQEFLNYLKWTEPVALMLALVEDEALAVRVVELALAVDLMLGARLAGEVRSDLQEKTVGSTSRLMDDKQLSDWVKIKLLGETRSKFSAKRLRIFSASSKHKYVCLEELAKINCDEVIEYFLIIFDHTSSFHGSPLTTYLEQNFNSYIAQELVPKLFSDSSAVRNRANSILQKSSPEILFRQVARLSTHKNPDIRCEALDISVSYGFDADLTDEIVFRGLDDNEINVRISAVIALGELKNQRLADDRLCRIMTENHDFDIKVAAAGVLVSKGNRLGLSFLLSALEDPRPEVTIYVLQSLGNLPCGELIGVIIPLLNISNNVTKEVSDQAEMTLLNIGKSTSSQFLINHLDNLSIENQETIFYLIGLIADAPALRRLMEESYNTDSQRRSQIARRLGRWKNKKVQRRLLDLMQDPNKDVRESSWISISKINSLELFYEISNNQEIDSLFRFSAKLALKGDTPQDLINRIAISIENSEDAIHHLIQKFLESSDSSIDLKYIVEKLIEIKGSQAAHVLPTLLTLLSTEFGEQAFRAIQGIQKNCTFYNYEIYQQAELRKADRTSLEGDRGDSTFATMAEQVSAIDRRTQKMAEQPSTISISGGTFNGPVNLASNQGHQPTTITDTQNNYFGTDEALQKQITDLQTFIAELEAQHPNIQTEEQANQLVQQQLDQIQTQSPDRWQKLCHQMGILKAQFFNPERHLQAAKATVVEVTKAKWEESLIVKAIVTYLDKFSETPGRGA